MLNYKVMVRKPIWRGMWKTSTYRIKYHIQQCTAQRQLCFPNRTQMAGGRPAPLIHRGNHLEIPCQACFLLVTLTAETDFQMELRQKAAQVLGNALVINARCGLSAMYTKCLYIHFHYFFQTSPWTILTNHTMRDNQDIACTAKC